MAIEYIGGITLKAPQHIEDKLAALAENGAQGRLMRKGWKVLRVEPQGYTTLSETFEPWDCSGTRAEDNADIDLRIALHNAAPSLLAVVRAARRKAELCHLTRHRHLCGECEVCEALADLDAVEV